MHLENSTTSIPEINRKNVGMGRRAYRRGSVTLTVQNRGDENSAKKDLLRKVHVVCELWSIGIIGPRLLSRVGHGSGVYEGGGSWRKVGSKVRRGFRYEGKAIEFYGGCG